MSIAVEPPLMAALKTKMQWHTARQGVIAENVANAATPGFRGHDLAPVESESSGLVVSRTNGGHLTLASASGGLRSETVNGFHRTPDGNSVMLEEQMAKAAQNQMDHQMVATLYSKSLGLIRTALGRRG